MSKSKRTYKPSPIDPDAMYVTRQQAARLFSVNVKLVDKWTRDNSQIRRLRMPGRGKLRPAYHVLICRADLERYAEKFLVRS